VLRADLLEHVGQHAEASSLLERALKSNRLSAGERAVAERVLAYVQLENGDVEGSIVHLQSAAALAAHAGDLETLFAAQARLMLVVSERSGPGAATPLLAEIRQLATKLGDPHITAALHLYVAEMEAKRGLLRNAAKHTGIANSILATSPNLYLEAFAENLALALSILRSQFGQGRSHGLRAVELAELSGVRSIYRSSVANLGNLFYAIGDFDNAVSYFERALTALPSSGEKTSASLDTLARVRLTQGLFQDCKDLLDRIDTAVRSEPDRALYANRYAELTKAQLLADQDDLASAVSRTEAALALAERASDTLLVNRILLTRANLLQRRGHIAAAMTILRSVLSGLVESPELYAQSEHVLAGAAAFTGDRPAAEGHYRRALRIYESLGTVPGAIELRRQWSRTPNGGKSSEDQPTFRSTSQAIHGIAAMLAHPDRPVLVAREIVEILSAVDCVDSARAVACGTATDAATLAFYGSPSRAETRTLSVGAELGQQVQVLVQPKNDVESLATINAISLIVAAMQELERARMESEERAKLWPSEESPSPGGQSVIAGHMRELMNQARKIATTTVNVLITGESGTGKEILARAIHDFSDRPQKPFVPFNCAAIPRDLLESQLFGHRRGAFTGADRDQLGIIRTANDGTLFLDEIGELGLDLQPKILRFLESGEIAPLGEPGALHVNVRIVAASNTNLEDAVRAGRFREDLYYRLNVVHLTIRPLRERRDEIPGLVQHFVARAAEEFKKGRLEIAEETMERLILYRWPGNVRQLQNELRRMVALAEVDSVLTPDLIAGPILDALPFARPAPASNGEIAVPLHSKLTPTLARVEGEMIRAAWSQHHGKVDAVAKALGISRKGLYLKRQRLGL